MPKIIEIKDKNQSKLPYDKNNIKPYYYTYDDYNNYQQFNFNINIIKNRINNEFKKYDDIKLSNFIFQTKRFYDVNKNSFKYGINKEVFKLWHENSGVGNKYRELVASAPLITVLTLLVTERKILNEYEGDTYNDDYICSILDTENDEEAKYEQFVKDSHFKRFGFLNYYLKVILDDKDYKQIIKDLESYNVILDIYNKIKNEMYDL